MGASSMSGSPAGISQPSARTPRRRCRRVPILDIGGDLVLPGLVDGHTHLDKTLMGLPWMPHMAGPTRMSRIETDKTILPHLPVSTEERAGNLIEACVVRGTAHLRTHVDMIS
jgi:cytosine/adenosine deaminase-related metal-dependent hydrolase